MALFRSSLERMTAYWQSLRALVAMARPLWRSVRALTTLPVSEDSTVPLPVIDGSRISLGRLQAEVSVVVWLDPPPLDTAE